MPVIRRRGPWRPVALAAMVVLAGCTGRGDPSVAAPVITVPGATAHPSPSGPPASSRDPSTTRAASGRPTTTGTDRPAGSPAAKPTTTGSLSVTPTVGSTVDLPVGVVPGASGLAPGPGPGTWFVQDDAPGTGDVVVVNQAGGLVGRVPLAGMRARNAEALAEGPCPDSPSGCLFVGDIGDNLSRRPTIVVYVAGLAALQGFSGRAVPTRTWSYTYPDRPHDAEAMLVAPDGSLVIVTKSTPDADGRVAPHRIYRGRPGGGELQLVRTFVPPPPALPLQSLLTGTVVTDAAYDGRRVLLLTYDEVIAYTAPRAGADPAAFPTWPHVALPHPPLVQGEGVAGLPDGCGYLVASEEGPGGHRAALAPVTCPP